MKKYNWVNIIIPGILLSFLLACTILMASSRQKLYSQVEEVSMSHENNGENFEIWTLEGKMEEVLEEILLGYKKKYPNINFRVKAYKNEIYSDVITNAARTGSLPDMFYTWGDRGLEALVEQDVVKDITSEVNMKAYPYMKEDALNSYIFNEHVYGMPAFGWNTVVYCNKELFEKYNLPLPTQYDEFLEIVQAFKSQGVMPLMLSGKEAWMSSLYYMELAAQKEHINVIRNLDQAPLSFKREGFVEAATQFKALIDLEPWQEGYMNQSPNEAILKFCKGEAAMMVGGSFMSSSIDDISHSLIKGKIAVIPFPGNEADEGGLGIGGYSDGFALNKGTSLETIDATCFFVALMKEISNRAVEIKGMGLPVYEAQTISKASHSTLQACYEIFPKSGYHTAYDRLLKTDFVKGYNEALLEFIQGDLAIKEFIGKVAEPTP